MNCLNCKEDFDPTHSFIKDDEDAKFFNKWFEKPDRFCGPCAEKIMENLKVL